MFKAFPHFGIHVSDIDASTRFYVEGLGFEALNRGRAEALGDLLGLDDAPTLTQFIRHPAGGTIELWQVEGVASVGAGAADPAHERGRLHLCLIVDDLDAAAERIVAFGGARLDRSRILSPYGRLMFCADPDGVRIELCEVKSG